MKRLERIRTEACSCRSCDVGPAGKLLDRAFTDAGIDRRKSYATNAVKHFRFEMRGKRRIHKKPTVMQSRRASRG